MALSDMSDELKYKFQNLKYPTLKDSGKVLLVILVTGITAVVAAVFAGILLALGGNATIANFQITFDPNITIAYLLVNFFISRYQNLTASQSYKFFLLSLLLSFTVTFIQGAILLVMLPSILQKLHLIDTNAQ